MVKFANRGKGKTSRRTTFKQKFKIQRKVKQYRKKLKKQAKNLKNAGIKHRKNPDRDVLPNMFPFKNQMLQQFKNSLPKQPEAPIQALNSAEFGLITMDNKPIYFPKAKQNLTKKYITNLDTIFKRAKIVLQVLDSRNPQICIDESFRETCKKNNVHVISVLSKIDTVPEKKVAEAQQKLTAKKERVVKFTQDNKQRKQLIQQIIKNIQIVKAHMGLKQSENVSVFVAGKQNTGKHSLITYLCKYAGKYQDFPSEIFELVLFPGIKLIDAPYKIEDKTNFPLFTTPSQIRHPDQSLNSQQENLLKYLFFGGLPYYKFSILSRNQILEHYLIQDYTSIEDLCKKIGKSLRLFGKGGMIDVAKVKNKVLSEWFQGRLNKFINPMNQ